MHTLALEIGGLFAILIIISFRFKKLEATQWAYPILLSSFPIFYWMFAMYAKDYCVLVKEILIGCIYFFIAFIAYWSRSFWAQILLGISFIVHAMNDIYHGYLFQNPGTPLWWPEFCGAIDILIGEYILYMTLNNKITKNLSNQGSF